MSYDEQLAERIRSLMPDGGVTEKKMFGGLAFLLNGNMAVAASGQGGLMVRCDPDDGGDWIDEVHVHPMEMRGRRMTGWLRVDPPAVETDEALQEWVDRGSSYAESLPAK